MRIISLRAENVKRLKAVEITPEGDVVVIAGRNAQGKTAVLDAIWMALAGASGAKETTRAIRDGEEKANVMLDLGDLVVTRKWTQAGTTLEVKAQDGARYPSPQTILDGLIGKLSFDPLAFAEQDQKGQLTTLLSVVDLPFDPEALALERADVFEKRTDANREVKRLQAQVAGVREVPEDTPDAEVSAADLIAELQAANDAVREMDRLTEDHVEAVKEERRLAREHKAAVARVAELTQRRAELPPVPDAAEIQERLTKIDETNANVRAKIERQRLALDLDKKVQKSTALTKKLDRIDKGKAEAMARAKMPLDGLSFDEEGVLYNGVPFGQSSAAERLRVGIAMAMALNPTIRVIRITDGSLLDSENLALIEQMAGEHDFQIWLERVDETGKVGITIEDGEVAHRA